jgi:release factor glutamine methyltransferase
VGAQTEGAPAAASAAEILTQATELIAAAGCETPEADAKLLVAKALSMRVEELERDGTTVVSPEAQAEVERYVARRREREPLEYILGSCRFREIEITVDEVGTGSGAIALALLSERPDLRVTASDLSPEAAEKARENAQRLGIALEVTVAQGIPDHVEEADLLIANLPYITNTSIDERSPEIRREPRVAVQGDPKAGDAGEDGLDIIRGLIEETPSGWRMALEHDTHHGPAMRKLLREAETRTDFRGDERVTVGLAP